MTDDHDLLLTIAGNAATDLFTLDGEVGDRITVHAKDGTRLGWLPFLTVRDRLADALGCHLVALRREVQRLTNAEAILHATVELHEKRSAELEAALRPFAELLPACLPGHTDGRPLFDAWSDSAWSDSADTPVGTPTVGDVRRAAELLSKRAETP